MGSRRAAVALAMVLVAGAPFAAAAWGVKGEMEPSTSRDAQDGFMFPGPDQSASSGRRVYFNGFMGTWAYYSTHVSPNAAALRSAIQPYPSEAWAFMGVWKDCNLDGFIGYGDPGLFEYKAELLTLPGGPGFSVCPNEGEIDPRFPFVPEGWIPPHNDGKWVHEFIPIGWLNQPASVDLNPWVINDTDNRVWADYGLPESRQALVCSVDPAPRGTYRSTGGFLAYADCLNGYKATATINQLAEAFPVLAPISFADKPMGHQGESRSILNVKNPWGQESDAALVSAWSCGPDPLLATKDPTWNGESGPTHVGVGNPLPAGDRTLWANLSDDDGWVGFRLTSVTSGAFVRYNVSTPRAPPGVDPAGSPSGTVNETEAGLDACDRDDPHSRVLAAGDQNAPYALEGNAIVQGATRVATDFALHYELGRSRAGPQTLTGRGAPPDMGVKLTGRESCFNTGVLYSFWCYDGLWRDVALSDATRVASSPNPYADRTTLSPQAVGYYTFYGNVGAGAVSRLNLRFPGTTGSYGAEGCAMSPPTFECDASLWWPGNTVPRTSWLGKDPADANLAPADQRDRPYGVRVGQSYQLRDVDCYDQSVGAARDEGLTWGTVTGTTCV